MRSACQCEPRMFLFASADASRIPCGHHTFGAGCAARELPRDLIRHLSKRYGALTALDDVSLEIEKGEIFALLGPNGAARRPSLASWPD